MFAPRERGVGKHRHSDQRERFGRDNREADHDPRNVFCAEKIILNRALRPAEERAEDGNSHQIEQQDCVIENPVINASREAASRE